MPIPLGSRMEIKVFGHIIGTASGCGQGGDFGIQFYDVRLNELGKKFVACSLPEHEYCLSVDFDTGQGSLYWCADSRDKEEEFRPNWGRLVMRRLRRQH